MNYNNLRRSLNNKKSLYVVFFFHGDEDSGYILKNDFQNVAKIYTLLKKLKTNKLGFKMEN